MEVIYYEKEMKDEVLKLDICELEKIELEALGEGKSAKEMLEESLDVSLHTWVAMEDNKVVAVGGVSLHSFEEGIGIPWLLSTDEFMQKYLFTINSLTLSLIEHSFNTLGLYLLTNRVSLNNRPSIKWLKYIGFEFMDAPKLINDVWFDTFYMYKEDYDV